MPATYGAEFLQDVIKKGPEVALVWWEFGGWEWVQLPMSMRRLRP